MLREHAPSWLLQLPGLISADERAALQHEYEGMARYRMLRELIVGLETLTEDTPMILVLEDLHWSDHSSLDLLTALARRRQPVRLLVIGTYRLDDAVASNHPLASIAPELQLHRHAVEQPLPRLSAAATHTYLEQRFPDSDFSTPLAALIHRQTGGNPLFLVNVVDHLLSQDMLTAVDGHWALTHDLAEVERVIPSTLQDMLEAQLNQLNATELRILKAASVAGTEFFVQAVSMSLNQPFDEIDACCRSLMQRYHFLRYAGEQEWPDGTVTTAYEFTHALYHDTLYQQLPAGQRRRLHLRVGECLEAGYAEDSADIATQLALHFEHGRDIDRAVQYLYQAGEQAVQRYAYHEAMQLLNKGLALLKTLPDSPERDQRELAFQVTLGLPLLNTKGFGAPEVRDTHQRALDLCQRLGETPQLFQVLEGLHTFYAVQGNLPVAYDLAQQLLRLARRVRDPLMLIEGHHTMGTMEFRRANLAAARSHLEEAVTLYDPGRSAESIHYSGHDPQVCCLGYLGVTLWYSGFPDQALHQAQAGLDYAHALNHPYTVALARIQLAWVYLLRKEGQYAQEQADATIALARKQGYPFYVAMGTMFRGGSRSSQGDDTEGMQQLSDSSDGFKAIGSGVGRLNQLIMQAGAHARAGRIQTGLDTLLEAETTIQQYGDRYLEAELYRIRGRLLAQQSAQNKSPRTRRTRRGPAHTHEAAEQAFQTAIDITRKQQAKSLELRATRSLCRLWQSQGKQKQARQTLSSVYGWFTEGFETTDLKSARALLEELGG